jgi:hypothetical protein
MTTSVHPAAPHHLPAFLTAPGETDVLMVGVAAFLVVAVLMVGNLFLRLHTLPERLAHKGHKLQFEIVAVLGLLALFTHVHLFWVAGLLLALIDIPDFSGAFARMAGALERIAGTRSEPVPEAPDTAARERLGALLVGGATPADGAATPADGVARPDGLARVDGSKREATHA